MVKIETLTTLLEDSLQSGTMFKSSLDYTWSRKKDAHPREMQSIQEQYESIVQKFHSKMQQLKVHVGPGPVPSEDWTKVDLPLPLP